jgi:outer membrane protein
MKIGMIALAALAALVPGVPARGEEAPLALSRALALLEEQSPEVRQERLRALENAALSREIGAGLGPQVALETTYSAQTSNLQGIGVIIPGFPSRVGPFRVFDARPRVTQTVLDLSLVARWRAARARVTEAEEDAEARLELLRLAVIQLYLQAQQAESRGRAAEARLATARALLEQARERFAAGAGNKLDVARAEQQQERERLLWIAARRDRDILSTMLQRTVGLPPGGAITLVPLHEGDREEAGVAPDVRRRELRALDARSVAAAHEVRAAGRQRWPQVRGFADYGVLGAAPNNSLSTWTAGVSVSVPVWTSGRIESSIRAARHRASQVEEERRRTEISIAQEVAQAQIERASAREAVEAAGRGAEAAREAVELARVRLDAGLATQLEVITAQGEWAEAEQEQIRALYDGLLASAKLAQARGQALAFLQMVVEGR